MNEKEIQAVEHIQTLIFYSQAMTVETQKQLYDFKFRQPNLNNHLSKAKFHLEELKKGLMKSINIVGNRSELEIEKAVQMNRVFSWFATMEVGQLEHFMDKAETVPIKDAYEVLEELK